MMRRKTIVGNWKMNGTHESLEEARAIAAVAREHSGVDVAICPPFTLIAAMATACPGMTIGGQDCHSAASGAFTGSVSAEMLRDVGASLVILGHSERREALGETSALVQIKAMAALSAGLDVILCVGESLAVREGGRATDHVTQQVLQSLPDMAGHGHARLIIAYEPIWAIGTGRTAGLGDIAEMHGAIRRALGDAGRDMAILYGGSVNGDNAGAIMALDDVDGALVGGASLTADKFAPIIAAAA